MGTVVHRSRGRRRGSIGAAILLVLLASLGKPTTSLAQTETGKIVGRVQDSAGAALPGVTVVLTAVATQTKRMAVTDDVGQYGFAALTPGAYEVAFELSRFAPQRHGTLLTVGATVPVNATLQIGSINEQVQVTAAPDIPAINTTTQDIAINVSGTLIRELPTITRNPYDFVAMSGNAANDESLSARGAMGFNLNGLRNSSTNILLDGATNNDEFAASVGQAVPLDSVSEFSVITSNFSAQFGRASAGIVNVATRSGGDAFHGSLYEFFRNDALSTNLFDNKAQGIEKDPFDRHQWGGSLGGPVKKGTLFFFGNLESMRVRSEATDTTLVLANEFLARAAQNTRDFFAAYPLSAQPTGRVVRAGDLDIDVVPGGLMARVPLDTPVFTEVRRRLPNDAGGGSPVDEHQLVARVDWNASPNNIVYVRYALQKQSFFPGTNANSPYQGFDTSQTNDNHSLLGSYSRVWSSRLTTQTKAVFDRLDNTQPLGEQPAGPTLYLEPGGSSREGRLIALPGYLPYSPGVAIPFGGPQKHLQLYQDATWLLGAHDIRVGGSYVYFRDQRMFGAFQNAVVTVGTGMGEGLENILRGEAVQFQGAIDPQGKFPGDVISLPVGQPSFSRDNRYHESAIYFNDSWLVRPRLRLNLGVRYEYYGVQANGGPRLDSNFYLGTGATLPEQIRNGRVQIAPDSPVGGLWAPDRNNVAPRVGFAWDVTGDGKTSLRAGYGIGYERNFGNVTFNVIQNPPNYAVLALNVPTDIPQLRISRDNAGPLAGTGNVTLLRTSLRAVDPHITNAYAHFWSVSFQRELLPRTVGSVEYTGSKGVDLYSITNINRVGAGAAFLGDASATSRLHAQYTGINRRGSDARSNYGGLTMSVENRGVRDLGLSFTARYTLGVAKDNLSTTFSDTESNYTLGLLDPFNPDLDYGYANFDARHRFVAAVLYETRVRDARPAAMRHLLGGWQVNAIFNAQTGMPFTVFDCTGKVPGGVCGRIVQVAPFGGYGAVPTGNPNSVEYLDLRPQLPAKGSLDRGDAGYEIPPPGGYPSTMTARNAFRRPGRYNVDAVFGKRVRVGKVGLQGRVEVYNVLNHANLYVDLSSIDFASTGAVEAFRGYSTLGGIVGDGQRRIQLAVRADF